MRSFARSVKEEVLQAERTDREYKAELAGIFQFLSSISISNRGLTMVIRTENPEISRFVMKMLKKYYDVTIETSIVRKMKLNKNKVYLLRVMNHTKEILEDLGLWTEEGLNSHPAKAYVSNRETSRSYLAGCFLASGSVNDPRKTDYHLEISANREEQGRFIMRAMKKIGITGKMIPRRNQFVVYIKSVDVINDFSARRIVPCSTRMCGSSAISTITTRDWKTAPPPTSSRRFVPAGNRSRRLSG